MPDILPSTLLKCRLAPTPSGFLHIGNAYSFVLSWLIVRRAGGRLQLRIDDGDRSRFRMAYLKDIFSSLHWLGLDWDRGPRDAEDFLDNYSQAKRQIELGLPGQELNEMGHLYSCTCSRKSIKEQWSSGLHESSCSLSTTLRPNASWRLKLPYRSIPVPEIGRSSLEVNPAAEMGQPVLRKKDGSWAYQVCSLAEDFRAGTNFIVRGQDLLPSSALQLYLAQLLTGSPKPTLRAQAKQFCGARFLHHPLMLDEAGNKLSKSAGSSSLRVLQQQGAGPELVYQYVARYLGVSGSAQYTLADWQAVLLGSEALNRLTPRF